jgi:putative ABC transport system permease protein
VGIAVALLTGLWLHDELSFNKYHKNYDRIAEVAMTGVTAYGSFTSSSLSYPMANLLRTDYKDQFLRLVRATDGAGAILSGGDNNFRVSGQYMDEGAPELFSLNMIWGSRTGLADMHSILLAASTARALFGDADPMGKTIRMDNKLSVNVTGVYEDLPSNTDLSYVHFIAPFTLYLSVNDWVGKKAKNDWTNHFLKLYAEIKPGADFTAIDGRIANSEFEHIRNIDDPNYRDLAAMHQKPMLYPMSRWHLEAADRWHQAGSLSPMRMVWIVCLIGAFHCLLYDEPLAGELPLSDGAVVVDLWLVGSRSAGHHPCNGEFPGCQGSRSQSCQELKDGISVGLVTPTLKVDRRQKSIFVIPGMFPPSWPYHEQLSPLQ